MVISYGRKEKITLSKQRSMYVMLNPHMTKKDAFIAQLLSSQIPTDPWNLPHG